MRSNRSLLQILSDDAMFRRDLVPICVIRDTLSFVNRRCAALLGRPDETFPEGLPLREVVAETDWSRVARSLRRATMKPGSSVSIVFSVLRRDGAIADLDLSGSVVAGRGEVCVVAVVSDITDRMRDDARLNHLAFYDDLTGLANRTLFFDRLRQLMLASRRSGKGFALLACDLDDFKSINDTYGHETGDRVLEVAAEILRSCCREMDTAARIGGDEFALMLPGVSDPNGAALVASRLIVALAEPIVIDGVSCCVGVSVGIALYPRDGEAIETLFRSADAAMYASKAAGRNCSSFADPGKRDGKTAGLHFIVWSGLHEVGIAATDAQHRKLAAMIGRVGAELAAGQDARRLNASFAELVAAARVHFATEEALMDRYVIPNRATHKHAHRRLLQDVQSLMKVPQETSMMVTMAFLHEWLLRHVDSADRDLARQLLAKGYVEAGPSGSHTLPAVS